MTRAWRAATASIGLALTLAGCGLPVPQGVRSTGDVQAAGLEPERIRVLLPGPRPGATAEEIVYGFLEAQLSPDDRHFAARQFLAAGTEWDDAVSARLYDPGSQRVERDPTLQNGYVVTLDTVAQITPRGAYRLDPDDSPTLREQGYVVAREPTSGELRLTRVPPGVRLSDVDLDRSFTPLDVYFLGRADDGSATGRLVPDRVFVPVTVPPAQAAVAHLLESGASDALEGAVATAVPSQTTSRPVRVQDGVVTVDLSTGVRSLDTRSLQRLSAQLVWTLAPFAPNGVRLLVDGTPLTVAGAGEVQTVDDWETFAPDAVATGASLLYVQDHRVRSPDALLPASRLTDGTLPVDTVVASPVGDQVAVLADAVDDGTDVVHRGPLAGPFDQVFSRPRLSSLSWGSGTRGLWVLQQGRAPIVWLLPGPDADAEAVEQAVPYPTPPGAGLLSQIRVSRDGARVALVFGAGADRALYVGTVQPGPRGPEIRDVSPVARDLSDVADVSWRSGTSLAVLAASTSVETVLPYLVAVDGSSTAVLQRPGVEGPLSSVASAPGRPLWVVTRSGDLFRDSGTTFVKRAAQVGAPAYPG